MKRSIGRIVIIAAVASVMGVIGRMDYADQQFDKSLSKEIRARVNEQKRADAHLDSICLALNSHQQHCQPDSP